IRSSTPAKGRTDNCKVAAAVPTASSNGPMAYHGASSIRPGGQNTNQNPTSAAARPNAKTTGRYVDCSPGLVFPARPDLPPTTMARELPNPKSIGPTTYQSPLRNAGGENIHLRPTIAAITPTPMPTELSLRMT